MFSLISVTAIFNPIAIGMLIHYSFYVYLVFTAKPRSIRATGFHQPVGSCNETMDVLTPTGNVRTVCHLWHRKNMLCEKVYQKLT